MAYVVGTANRIRRIVRLRQMVRNWRDKARFSSPPALSSSSRRSGRAPSDVPAGHVAIYAGRVGQSRRFVVRATHLNHPVFAKLLAEAEEYGFGHDGPLMIPCEESVFEDVVRFVSGSVREIGCGKAAELRPLRGGLVQKPVW